MFNNEALNSNPIEQQVKHEKCSDKYNFVNTQDLITRLQGHGWNVFKTSQAKVRKLEYSGFQKHLIRLTNDAYKVNGLHLELIIINSHMSSSSVQLKLGIYRLVCANGLVVGSDFLTERIRHVGFTHDKLDNALTRIMHQAPKVFEIIAAMQVKELTSAEILELAKAYALKRLESIEHVKSIDFNSMLKPLREDDNRKDLFTVYNVLQEKIMRQGVSYTYERAERDEHNNVVAMHEYKGKTRQVKNIDNTLDLNEYMFNQAYSLLLKNAA